MIDQQDLRARLPELPEPSKISEQTLGGYSLAYTADQMRTYALEAAAQLGRVGDDGFYPAVGQPPSWFDEWFIAKLDNGDRVVLRKLPEEYSFDYTTADGTYFKAFRLKSWMQFPDSKFKQLGTPDSAAPGGDVEQQYEVSLRDGETILSTAEALPCPFCGHQPTIQHWHGGGPRKRLIHCPAEYYEQCAVTPSVTGSTRIQALARWNRRAARE